MQKYCGKKTVELAVVLAVLQFHKGAGALADGVDSLGGSPGMSLMTVASTIVVMRLRFASRAAQTQTKTIRKRKAMEKIKQNT